MEVAAGPDGNLWFTEYLANRIGRLVLPAATSFFTVAPCRAFDSRHTSPFAAGSETPVPLAGRCGIPPGATGVAQLGASGAVALYVGQASGSVHVILDVSGYFVP